MKDHAAFLGLLAFFSLSGAAAQSTEEVPPPAGMENLDRELASSLNPMPQQASVAEKTELRFTSSTPAGEAGLFRVMEAGSTEPWTVRLSLHGGFFVVSGQNAFLNYLGIADYQQSYFGGALNFSFTPLEYLEVFASLGAQSNKNSITRPELLQSFGDFELGAKGCYRFQPYLAAGADLAVSFASAVGEVGPKFSGTNLRTAALLSFDLRPLVPEVPLRAHLNAGFILENSEELAGGRDLNYVELFALGVNRYHRVALGLGLDAPLPYAAPVAISPFLEYRVELPLGISDQELDSGSLGQDTKYINVVPMLLTPGVRVTYLKDLTLDVAVEIGIGGKKAYLEGVPSVPPWRLWFGLSYAFDPTRRGQVQVVEKVVEKPVEKPVPQLPPTGRVQGRVADAVDQKPIADAIIVFEGTDITPVATDQNGRYETYDLTPGLVRLTARRQGFKAVSQEAEVKAAQAVELNFLLEPEQKLGTLGGTVTDQKDAPLAARVFIGGPAEAQIATAENGSFTSQLPEGTYTVRAEAEGFLAKSRTLKVEADQKVLAEFKLTPAPKTRVVVLKKDRIELKRTIHFESGKAVIMADSFIILDEVVDVLAKNPQIKKVRIEGHTDSVGSEAANMILSQKRADAVREYLLTQGIAPERLLSQGYGPTRPIAPNNTRRGRELNRRVEFIILEQ
jgi:OOP family OmpA-OmpF porin